MIHEPRPVKFRTIFDTLRIRSVLLHLGIVFSLFGGFSVVMMTTIQFDDGVSSVDYSYVKEHGRTAVGTITEIVKQDNVRINEQHPYVISYNYILNDTNWESKFKTLDYGKVSHMNVGDTIQVKHLEGESVIPSLEPCYFSLDWFMFFPLGLALTGLTCLGLLVYFTRRQLYLYRFGIVLEAELVSMTYKLNKTISGTSTVEVYYRYQTGHGEPLLRSCRSRDVSLLNTLKQGDCVKIFVSPEDDSKSTMVPNLEVVRNGWKID